VLLAVMPSDKDTTTIVADPLSHPQTKETSPEDSVVEEKRSLRRRFREILWDSLDRTPEERWFIHKIDFFILTWASLSYFSKNLNTNNVSK
jgi:ACS family pantothenate transporter-like MFS transporter